jgi:outer membrane protein assembly factor BamE (lipoprotein component of BamABCDE complex)
MNLWNRQQPTYNHTLQNEIMKTAKTICLQLAIFSACLCLWGCATETTTTTGKDFDSSKVSQIVKGKTTADEIVAMFGTPYTKQPDADDGEKWEYFYSTSTVKSSGMTVGGGLAAILIPGSAGNVIASQNYNPGVTVHNKILTVSLDKQKIVEDVIYSK